MSSSLLRGYQQVQAIRFTTKSATKCSFQTILRSGDEIKDKFNQLTELGRTTTNQSVFFKAYSSDITVVRRNIIKQEETGNED